MIKLRSMKEFDASNITAKDACRIFSSSKPYLVRVEDNIHMTKDFQSLVARLYPEVEPHIVEVFVLNHL